MDEDARRPDDKRGSSTAKGGQAELPPPRALIAAIFAQWSPELREQFLKLFLLKCFSGQARALTLFEDADKVTAQFLIRYAGPHIAAHQIDSSNLSNEAKAALQKYC